MSMERVKAYLRQCCDNAVNMSRTAKTIYLVFFILAALVLSVESSQTWYGIVEGVTDLDLSVAQSGRCRLDNPRATIAARGTELCFGRVNVPGRGWQDHVWGYDAKGKIVDVVCPDTNAICRETRSHVFATLKLEGMKASVVRSNDEKTDDYVKRVNGILIGLRLSHRL